LSSSHTSYTVAGKAIGFAPEQPLHVVALVCPASGILKQPEYKRYHIGIRSPISLNNLSHATQKRDWRIFADFAKILVDKAHVFYQNDENPVKLKTNTAILKKVDKTTGVQCDQIVVLTNSIRSTNYPEQLRRIRYYDAERKKRFVFLTNNMTLY
jgi:ribosomal protein L28